MTEQDAIIATARKEAEASVRRTLRKLRRGLFLVDPTFENFECWRQAERPDYWSADAKQFVIERVLRGNVSVGEKLEFFMRVGLFNEYNQVRECFFFSFFLHRQTQVDKSVVSWYAAEAWLSCSRVFLPVTYAFVGAAFL